jgi:hypothetical protein
MSDYLNFSITNEEEIFDWVLQELGYPLIEQMEITESQLRQCKNNAVEYFTKYAIQDEVYIALDLEDYNTSGFTLPNNVVDIFALEESNTYGNNTGGINTLFSVQNTMFNNGTFPIPGSGGTGSWVDYHLAMQYLELTRMMTASRFDFNYNEREQVLTLIPNPSANEMKGHIVIGCHTIRREDLQLGEKWVKEYTLARAKIMIGNVRIRFEGTQLLGGGTLDTGIKQEGLDEKKELEEELRQHYAFVGFLVQ